MASLETRVSSPGVRRRRGGCVAGGGWSMWSPCLAERRRVRAASPSTRLPVEVVVGGETRQESVAVALAGRGRGGGHRQSS